MSKLTSTIAASALTLGLGGGMLAVSAPAAHAAGHANYKTILGPGKTQCKAQLGAIVVAKAADRKAKNVHVTRGCHHTKIGYAGTVYWWTK